MEEDEENGTIIWTGKFQIPFHKVHPIISIIEKALDLLAGRLKWIRFGVGVGVGW